MTDSVTKKLSTIDRYLPLWIFAAMALGIGLGRAWPGIGPALDRVKLGTVSLPIAIGLLWMMYPVLAKVKYGKLGHLTRGKLLGTSLVFNWIIGPILMFALAWLFLPDLPHYRTGLILIGLARCIAMVLIWNMLACGSGELAAVLVALNSVFQIIFYSVLGWLFITVVPGWLGADVTQFHVSMWAIAKSVGIFLGVPLLAGALTRFTLVRRRGEEWYETKFLPRIGPTALLGLLYTIVLMFAMQGDKIIAHPLDVLRIALAARHLLRDHIRVGVPGQPQARLLVRGDRGAVVHRGRQQLRAGDRRRRRALRHQLRRSARRRRRSAHRGAGADRARLPVVVAARSPLPRWYETRA